MLWIFITLKNPSLSARFEPTNLGYNDKHCNHYTTKNNLVMSLLLITLLKVTTNNV
jgi:hypothetical protein